MTDGEIRVAMVEEILELLDKMLVGDSWDAIADEAGDVYHYAGMGASPERIEYQRTHPV
jgi:NTP pyrophosphatase (non-canonical NTP hydrolase)